jgi:hypothetical protein
VREGVGRGKEGSRSRGAQELSVALRLSHFKHFDIAHASSSILGYLRKSLETSLVSGCQVGGIGRGVAPSGLLGD